MALVAPLAVGLLGSLPTARAIPIWYRTLDKPSWKPPDVVFGPVWTTLYLLMGIALVLVRRAAGRTPGRTAAEARRAQVVFWLQLALNLAWSLVFFGARSPRAGLVVIALLWASIVVTIVEFGRIRSSAAVLLAPYLAWVSFASVLNAEIVHRNP